MDKNTLYYGDNLDILRRYLKDETIALIYLDPPFNSNQDYNVLFEEQNGAGSKAQIKAFEDTWHWGEKESTETFHLLVEAGGKLSETMQAFRMLMGENDMLAYLSMMAPRLVEMKRVLKSGGSIYLHCDSTASAHLRILMDAIFGPRCFQNEIIWSYRRWPSPSNHFQRMHDVLLFYSKGKDGPAVFNVEYEESSPSYQKRFKGKTQMLDPLTRTRKITLEEDSKGLARRDVWDISIIAGFSKERMGYPTQKPEALLDRIIQTSSNEGDIVLDPFCGCGTAVVVAERLKRKWIGIDITHLAVTLMRHRLDGEFGEDLDYEVIGEPVSLPDAETLAQDDPYQFQYWALGLVGARPVESRKGADRGIDGRLYFHDDPQSGNTKQIVISVKSGQTGVAHVRDLRGVIEREKAEIGVLISLQEPTRNMKIEVAGAGFYSSPWGRHPRLQLLTIRDLLSGKRIDYPPAKQVNSTFKKIRKTKKKKSKGTSLPFKDEN